MIVLGVSAYYHDSAAAIVRDGEIVAAAQEAVNTTAIVPLILSEREARVEGRQLHS